MRIVLIVGQSNTGKTTIARRLVKDSKDVKLVCAKHLPDYPDEWEFIGWDPEKILSLEGCDVVFEDLLN